MKAATALGLAAIILALLASLYLSFGDGYRGESCFATPGGGQSICESTSATFIEVNGNEAIPYLLLPLAVTTGVVVAMRLHVARLITRAVSVVFSGLCVLAIFSIGLMYLPSALLLIAATATQHDRA